MLNTTQMKTSGDSSTDFKIGDHVIEKNERRWEGVIVGIDDKHISTFTGGDTFQRFYRVRFNNIEYPKNRSHGRYGDELELNKRGIINRFFQ